MIRADMPEREYHAHPAFSSTQARQILDSPARYQYGLTHPRPDAAAYDVGTAVHSRVLGTGSQIKKLDFDSYRTNAAKEARDDARAAGMIPMLAHEIQPIDDMAEAVLAHKTARALLDQSGTPEASVFGTDPATGVAMRARFDHLADARDSGPRITVDIKTTAGSASKEGFAKAAASYRYDVQRGHYLHALELATGERDAEMVFLTVEKEPPYLVAVHQLEQEFADFGIEDAERARQRLAECRATDTWPGHPEAIGLVKAPVWLMYQRIDMYGTD